MHFLVQPFNAFKIYAFLVIFRKLILILFWFIFFQCLQVAHNGSTNQWIDTKKNKQKPYYEDAEVNLYMTDSLLRTLQMRVVQPTLLVISNICEKGLHNAYCSPT